MNKAEILSKSRADNSGSDEREQFAIARSNQIASLVGGLVCATIIIYDVCVGASQNYAAWAVYLSITGTTLFVKFLKLGHKHELAFGLFQLILATAFLIMEFVTKWPQN